MIDDKEIEKTKEKHEARRILRKLRNAVDDIEELWPFEEELNTLCEKMCSVLGHSWEFDQCGYLDHTFCIYCSKGSSAEDLDSLLEQFSNRSWKLRFSSENKRHVGWKEVNLTDPRLVKFNKERS